MRFRELFVLRRLPTGRNLKTVSLLPCVPFYNAHCNFIFTLNHLHGVRHVCVTMRPPNLSRGNHTYSPTEFPFINALSPRSLKTSSLQI